MNIETFIQHNCHNAPHLTNHIAEFMLNAGVTQVLEELHTAIPGWECDLYSWLVVGDNEETFTIETDHGGPFRSSVAETLAAVKRHQSSYSSTITTLTSALQQKAHVIA